MKVWFHECSKSSLNDDMSITIGLVVVLYKAKSCNTGWKLMGLQP